ncbi:MAG: FeoB small GTPase domain-containing protein [Desulfotomaculaceae bacterium]|nr:FeoB small GTPase domain-containing protein [Desulfotomaculaceae bacterium]
MLSRLPITEEEAVARRLLLYEHQETVIHVVDAKNLQTMPPVILQLID